MLIQNRSLRLLFLYNSVFCFAAGLLGPLYAVYVGEINDKVFWVSASWAVSLLTTTVVVYIMSKVGDKYDHRNLLVLGFIFRSVAWTILLFAGNLFTLIIAMFFVGVGEGFGTPAFNSVFAEHLDDGQHIAEYSDWAFISNLVVAASTILGGLIVTKFGFETMFILMILLSFVSAIGVSLNGKLLKSSK